MVNVILKISFCFLLLFLSGCDGSENRSSGPEKYVIAGEIVSVPPDWKFWHYSKIGKGEEAYDQIIFSFDVNTLINVEQNSRNENGLSVELRPVNSEFGEKWYWTNKDNINNAKIMNCEDIKINNEVYEHCYHADSKEQVASFVETNIQSIKDKKTGKYISVFGCAGELPSSIHMNRVCVGRSRITDDLQVEYSYRFFHFNRAVDIDLKIRNLMLGLLK